MDLMTNNPLLVTWKDLSGCESHTMPSSSETSLLMRPKPRDTGYASVPHASSAAEGSADLQETNLGPSDKHANRVEAGVGLLSAAAEVVSP
jgi:hypothetical protein